MKPALIFLFSLIALGFSLSHENEKPSSNFIVNTHVESDSTIVWNSSQQLTWDDFKGETDTLSGHDAITSSKISLSVDNMTDSLKITVTATFNKYKSWSIPKSGSEKLLSHEQLHFDITELIARKIRAKLSTYTYQNIGSMYNSIQKVYNDYTGRVWDGYDAYDAQTKHGIIRETQLEWEAKIAAELETLKEFEQYSITVHRKK